MDDKDWAHLLNAREDVIEGFEKGIAKLKELDDRLAVSPGWPEDPFAEGILVGLRIALLIFGRLGK